MSNQLMNNAQLVSNENYSGKTRKDDLKPRLSCCVIYKRYQRFYNQHLHDKHSSRKLCGAKDSSWQCEERHLEMFKVQGAGGDCRNISPIYRGWLHSLGRDFFKGFHSSHHHLEGGFVKYYWWELLASCLSIGTLTLSSSDD